MIVTCVQMKVRAGDPDFNYRRAERLVRKAAKRKTDVILLPETWNTGFAPGKIDPALADEDGARTKALISALAKELNVNIVAGSVTNRKADGVYNTAYVFDRAGNLAAEYDKTHLFSPMGEDAAYRAGDKLARFQLDGASCAMITCYDLRFPELARSLALPGLDILFVVSEWPKQRVQQLDTLARARAIENQCFLALCNGCGEAYGTRYGGHSAVYSMLGNAVSAAGSHEKIFSAELDLAGAARIRELIPVMNDRRPELYGAVCRTEPDDK